MRHRGTSDPGSTFPWGATDQGPSSSVSTSSQTLLSVWTDRIEQLSLVLSTGPYNCLVKERERERERNEFWSGWKGDHIHVTMSPRITSKISFKYEIFKNSFIYFREGGVGQRKRERVLKQTPCWVLDLKTLRSQPETKTSLRPHRLSPPRRPSLKNNLK